MSVQQTWQDDNLPWWALIKWLDPFITLSWEITWPTKMLYLEYHSAYGYQTRKDGDLHWGAPIVIVTWPFNDVVLLDHVTN